MNQQSAVQCTCAAGIPGSTSYGSEFHGLTCPKRARNTEDELEQTRVQLAGCSVAALGWNHRPAKRGDYGWSQAYQDVLELRQTHDRAQLVQREVKRLTKGPTAEEGEGEEHMDVSSVDGNRLLIAVGIAVVIGIALGAAVLPFVLRIAGL